MKIILIGLLILPGLALARMEDRTKELHTAAGANDLAAVRAILDESDQNVNVPYGKGGMTPLMLACMYGNLEMARLLVSKGAEVDAVDAGGRPVIEQITMTHPDSYRALRELILRTAAEKKIDLPLSWQDIWLSDDMPYTAAATYDPVLPATGMTDGNPRTAWAGKAGDELWVFVNAGARTLSVVNGYNKTPALFKANNRVKTLAVSLWTAAHLDGDVSEVAKIFRVARLTPDHVVTLQDTGREQVFPLPFDWAQLREANSAALASLLKRPGFKAREIYDAYYVLRAEPLEVYRGAKYDDTCISELKAGSPWREEPRLRGDWAPVSGTDGRSLTFSSREEDRAFFAYRDGKPYRTGTWRMEDGALLIETGGETRRYTPEIEKKGPERLLKLTGAGGKVEVYKYVYK